MLPPPLYANAKTHSSTHSHQRKRAFRPVYSCQYGRPPPSRHVGGQAVQFVRAFSLLPICVARPCPPLQIGSAGSLAGVCMGCFTSFDGLFCRDAIVLFWAVRFVLVGRTFSIRVISCRRRYPLPHIPEGYSVRRRQPLEAPREGVTPPATNNADRGAPARQGAGSYPAPTSAVPSRQKRDCRHLSDSLMVQVL